MPLHKAIVTSTFEVDIPDQVDTEWLKFHYIQMVAEGFNKATRRTVHGVLCEIQGDVDCSMKLNPNVQPTQCTHDELVNDVLAQICKDVNNGDLTAIEVLLTGIEDEQLRGFLPT
jgi:hypothetical protein